MDCKCNKEKHSYHFNVSEVKDGKIREVMDFNFGGHHDIAVMAQTIAAKGDISENTPRSLQSLSACCTMCLRNVPTTAPSSPTSILCSRSSRRR